MAHQLIGNEDVWRVGNRHLVDLLRGVLKKCPAELTIGAIDHLVDELLARRNLMEAVLKVTWEGCLAALRCKALEKIIESLRVQILLGTHELDVTLDLLISVLGKPASRVPEVVFRHTEVLELSYLSDLRILVEEGQNDRAETLIEVSAPGHSIRVNGDLLVGLMGKVCPCEVHFIVPATSDELLGIPLHVIVAILGRSRGRLTRKRRDGNRIVGLVVVSILNASRWDRAAAAGCLGMHIVEPIYTHLTSKANVTSTDQVAVEEKANVDLAHIKEPIGHGLLVWDCDINTEVS